MADPTKRAITILDITLILMTAVWILFGVYRGLTLVEMVYNWIFVTVNISTLILNLRLINR
jgi:hypothetical protein